MIFQEVQKLRRKGDIASAYNMAAEACSERANDIWSIRALSLCIYDQLKAYANFENRNEFIEKLIELDLLGVPEDDMVWNLTIYPIATIIRNCKISKMNMLRIGMTGDFNLNSFNHQIFRVIKKFPFKRKTAEYSYLLQVFVEQELEWTGIVSFVQWWGLKNFRDEDFRPTKSKKNVIIPALAEWSVLACARRIVASLSNPLTNDYDNDINFAFEAIDMVIGHCPDNVANMAYYQNLSYYKFKILMLTGKKTEAKQYLETVLCLFDKLVWGWKELLLLSESEKEKKIVCLCNLIQRTPFLADIPKYKKILAQEMVLQGKFDEAKTEIVSILHDERTSADIFVWAKNVCELESWYRSAIANSDNGSFYNQHSLLYNAIQ